MKLKTLFNLNTFSFIAMALFVTACASLHPPKQLLNRPAPHPINSICVGKFQCANEVTAQAVRNVFLEVLAHYGDVKVVQEGDADVVIQGTVTLANGGSSSGSVGGNGYFIVGKNHSILGDYVSGVTSLALRNGEVLTSASYGQNLGKGLLPPESVARIAANRLAAELVREGMKRQ
jgi:hypothetical protein